MNLAKSLIAIASTCLIITSCTKSRHTSTCASTLHGFYSSYDSEAVYPTYSCSAGIFNFGTGLISGGGTFNNNILFTHQGTYNTYDEAYYVMANSGDTLYKIDAGGTVTTYTNTDAVKYYSITYNSPENKLYCIKSGCLAQINISGTTFNASTVASLSHPLFNEFFSQANIAVNNATGDMFVITSASSSYFVEKWHPGSSTSSVVASGSGGLGIAELRYNKNDGMLYALQMNSDTLTYDLIKVNPTSATISSVGHLGSIVDVDMYSAALDPCSNTYIISTAGGIRGGVWTPWGGVIYKISMTGSILSSDTTTYLMQGLDIAD
jgi:hypothetical protein